MIGVSQLLQKLVDLWQAELSQLAVSCVQVIIHDDKVEVAGLFPVLQLGPGGRQPLGQTCLGFCGAAPQSLLQRGQAGRPDEHVQRGQLAVSSYKLHTLNVDVEDADPSPGRHRRHRCLARPVHVVTEHRVLQERRVANQSLELCPTTKENLNIESSNLMPIVLCMNDLH